MSGHYADHHPKPVGPQRSWGYRAEGPGRWFVLERPLGNEVGLMFVTDQDDAVGIIQNGAPGCGHAAMDVALGIQAAHATGICSPSVVFDAWAGRATQAVAAGQVHHTDDLGAVASHYSATGQAPPPSRFW